MNWADLCEQIDNYRLRAVVELAYKYAAFNSGSFHIAMTGDALREALKNLGVGGNDELG